MTDTPAAAPAAPKPPVASPGVSVSVASPAVAEAKPITAAPTVAQTVAPKASSVQVGGDHYKNLHIQPFQYVMDNDLNFMQGSAIKYITRYKDKGGIEDLKKAIHTIELLIEWETKKTT